MKYTAHHTLPGRAEPPVTNNAPAPTSKPASRSVRLLGKIACVALLALIHAERLAAQSANPPGPGEPPSSCPVTDYFANWFKRVDATLAEQPHWAPPVATTTPRLQELFRYDVMWQNLKGGHELVNYGSGKGIEFIPAERIQFIIGLPPWETQNTTPRKNGWGDEMFLMKYRFAAANEEQGNYIVTGFMAVTVPNGSSTYTSHHFVYSPTLAGGKGWGDFDVQASVGAALPDNLGVRSGAGTSLLGNVILQYRVAKVIWPEVEANNTYWPNGVHEGLNQLFITPGLVLGRFPIWGRLACMVGAGCQVAVTDNPLYHRNIILSARLPF
jgi:hypothetical protein